MTLGGRRVGVERPRVRATDGSGELPVPAYELFSSTELLGRLAMEKMLAGLSTRRYAPAGLEPVGEQLTEQASSTSKSAVSRRFVAQTETALAQLLSADLSGLDLVAFMVDGVHFAESCCVVALGITLDDTKVPLSLVEGSTENATLVTELIVGLRERGLDVTRPVLAVLDGSKALRRAVLDVFDAPVFARCQLHKIRNVRDKLPQRLRPIVERRIRATYHADSAIEAEARLVALARELDKTHPAAAASLREGLAETLAVLRLGTAARPGSCRPFGPASALTSASISAAITCRPAPTARASSPTCMFSAISAITTLTRSGTLTSSSSGVSTDVFWYFFTAVPCLKRCLGGRPTPTARQDSGGGPPPQLPRGPGQPQLASVARAHLLALVQRTGCLAGIETQAYIDIDSLLRPVFGHAKWGASFGHTKIAGRQVLRRGLSPLATTISTDSAAPVIARIGLRAGRSGSGKGAASMVREAIRTTRAADATGAILVCGHSAYGSAAVIGSAKAPSSSRCWRRTQPCCARCQHRQAGLDPGAVCDPDTGALISDAEVTEVSHTAFAGTQARRDRTADRAPGPRPGQDRRAVPGLAPPPIGHQQRYTGPRGRHHPPPTRQRRDRVRRPDRQISGAPAVRVILGKLDVGDRRADQSQPAARHRHLDQRRARHGPRRDPAPSTPQRPRPTGPPARQGHPAPARTLALGEHLDPAVAAGPHPPAEPHPRQPDRPPPNSPTGTMSGNAGQTSNITTP